jgi:triosephosphate isomerase
LTKFQDAKGKNFVLVAQNSYYENQGAFTGEISPRVLKEINVR